MFHLSAKRVIGAAIVALGAGAIVAALAQPFNKHEKSADGLTAYLDVTSAATVKRLRTLHGGTPNGLHDYHIDVAIFDTTHARRLSEATVTAKILGFGLAGQERRLEPMGAAEAATYGGFIHLPGPDVYAIELKIERAGLRKPVILNFNYDHRRSN